MEQDEYDMLLSRLNESLAITQRLIEQGALNQAAQLCNRVLQIIPDQPEPIYLLGHIEKLRGNDAIALEWFRKCHTLDPERVEFLNGLGDQLTQTGGAREAISLHRRALEINPGSADCHAFLGNALKASGQIPEAIDSYKKALCINPALLTACHGLSAAMLPGADYIAILNHFHEWLQPESYIEIGVEAGKSLALAKYSKIAVGIDPDPQITKEFQLHVPTKVYSLTSDLFFSSVSLTDVIGQASFGLAFVDGLHLFEQALKDFINLERFSSNRSVLLFHDCYPISAETSTRTRATPFWSGDTWKVIPCLKKYRPDLAIFTIAAAPSGLGLVLNLDSTSTVLRDNFEAIANEFIDLDYSFVEKNRNNTLNVVKSDWITVRKVVEENVRNSPSHGGTQDRR